jgi:hypothetical protein
VLTERERKIWDEIERAHRAEFDEVARAWTGGGDGARNPRDLPAVVIGGGWGAVLLVLFGVPMAGVAVGAAAALVWLMWRSLPQLQGAPAAADPGADGDGGRPAARRRRPDPPWQEVDRWQP